jgi:glucose-1-phosphate adenylyltransferase
MSRQPARASSGRYVSRLTGGTLAIIMAGGRGERLRDLTEHRCKPATPFGGKFRIIDFVLSNCVNSDPPDLHPHQYKAQSLIQHVQHGWSHCGRVRGVRRSGPRSSSSARPGTAAPPTPCTRTSS